MKKKYCIGFTGVFEGGYVQFASKSDKKKTIQKYDTIAEAKKNATKFRFKWFANLICYVANKTEVLKTFKVIEL